MNLRALALTLALALALAAPAAAGSEDLTTALSYVTVDRAKTVKLLELALERAPAAEQPVILLNLAEQYRLADDDKAARKAFKDLAKGGGSLSRAGDLGLVVMSASGGVSDSDLEVLRGVAAAQVPATLDAARYALLALASTDADTAGKHARKSLDLSAQDPTSARQVRALLERATSDGEAVKPTALVGDDLIARLDAAVAAGDRAAVTRLADTLRASAGDDADKLAIARYALKRLDAAPVQSALIGVLLPRTGKYHGVGDQVAKALELGRSAGGASVKFVYADTGEDSAAAVAAAERLVLKDGVIALVGPLRSEVAVDVARVANALRVPLIGLHQDVTATDGRPWVLDGLATPEAQSEALVDYVMAQRGMKAFAIFAPDNAYGQSAADVFTAQVQARGGTIAVREHYDAEATDLIPFAKKLGRKDYTARAAEWREVKRTIEEAGGDPGRAVLPPVLDFDAIFLPDNRRRIPVAVAGLAYEEFPVGQFQIKKEGPTVPLLGLSGWNHPELINTGGPYVRDSLFVDTWLPEAPGSAAFIDSYKAETGRSPNTLEVQAWTVAKFAAAAGAARVNDRAAYLTNLLATRIAASGTGADHVNGGRRRIEHAMHVLTLDKDGIRQVASSPSDAAESGTPQ